MAAPLKFRFRWRALGQQHEATLQATSYPSAVYLLGCAHAHKYADHLFADDFAIDLSKPERVE